MRGLISIALAGMLLAAAPAAPAYAGEDRGEDLLYEETVDGNAAFGVRVHAPEGADFALHIHADAPRVTSIASHGVYAVNADGSAGFGLMAAGHKSPDRETIRVANEDRSAEWLDVVDAIIPEHEEDRPPSRKGCTLSCLEARGRDVPEGTHDYVMWAGGGSQVRFAVTGTDGVSVDVGHGTAHVLGDAEIENGEMNVQVQRTLGTPLGGVAAGVKAMDDAGTRVAVEDRLWGMWGLSDFKRACQWRTVTCADAPLEGATGAVSWENGTTSGTGRTSYLFRGTDAGTYAFTVDRKVDAYGPAYWEGVSRTDLGLGEHASYLSVADVAVPR